MELRDIDPLIPPFFAWHHFFDNQTDYHVPSISAAKIANRRVARLVTAARALAESTEVGVPVRVTLEQIKELRAALKEIEVSTCL